MPAAITRWIIYFFALLIAGPLAGKLILLARAVDGGPGSPLVCASPVMGLLAAVGAVGIALLVGLASVRFIALPFAMTAAGYILAWAAWRSATVDQLIRTAGSGAPLSKLAVEGLILGLAGIVAAFALFRLAPRPAEGRPEPIKFDQNTLVCILVGTVAGGVAAWLIAVTPLKGQAVFAGLAGGIFAAAACRLVHYDTPFPVMFVPVAILAVIGPLTGVFFSGSVVGASYRGELFALAHISPLDWIAGGMLGIPIGVSWAGSMIEKRIPEPVSTVTIPSNPRR